MKTIAVVCEKGGVGKSVLATSFTMCRAVSEATELPHER